MIRMIQRILTAALALLCAAGCASCDGGGETTVSPTDTAQTDTAPAEVDEEGVTYIDGEEFYEDGYGVNSIIGMDRLGRTFEATAGEKTDTERSVGLFYFMTLGQHDMKQIYNVTEILAMENGVNLMFSVEDYDASVAPEGVGYFWGEPLYGYYNSADSWVIRKHLVLLAEADVDFLIFDVTNGFTYPEVHKKIIAQVCEMRRQGFDVPGIAFYTHSYSMNVASDLYGSLYKTGLYDDAWFRYNGKPLIVAYTKPSDDKVATGDASYNPAEYSDEIREYFSFKRPEWPSEYTVYRDSLPWIEWSYPAPVHGDSMNVAVAAHPALPMSYSITRGAKNFGRGYNVTTGENVAADANSGTYFQATWDVAHEKDPSLIMVTGWNEWVATKSLYGPEDDREYMLVDTANLEFSRDCEMVKGGYADAFYIQLAANIRRYKRLAAEDGLRVKTERVTIDMNDDMTKWHRVDAVFRSVGTDNRERYSVGAAPTVSYTQPSADNNIVEIRVTRDYEFVYFYIKTTEAITKHTQGDTSWMNLLIGTGKLEKKGWEGYEYIVNRTVKSDTKSAVEKLNEDFTGTECGEAELFVSGNIMQIKIPQAALGLDSSSVFYFKAADSVQKQSDIMDYYVSGKSVPLGGLSFRYLG